MAVMNEFGLETIGTVDELRRSCAQYLSSEHTEEETYQILQLQENYESRVQTLLPNNDPASRDHLPAPQPKALSKENLEKLVEEIQKKLFDVTKLSREKIKVSIIKSRTDKIQHRKIL